MKQVFWSIAIALLSSAFTFLMMSRWYAPPAPEAGATSESRLVSTVETSPQPNPLINQPPRLWRQSPPADFVSTSKLVTAAVVNINTLSASGYRISSGSGVIISSDGYIITNDHVIEDGSSY